jgi:hypothetical protein
MDKRIIKLGDCIKCGKPVYVEHLEDGFKGILRQDCEKGGVCKVINVEAPCILDDNPQKGKKWDSGKLSWHAMPLVLLKPLAEVFNAGMEKYEKFNCLQPFNDPDCRFYDAAMRHMEACQLDPLAKDEETQCYHAAQVAFNVLMRLYHCKKEEISIINSRRA